MPRLTLAVVSLFVQHLQFSIPRLKRATLCGTSRSFKLLCAKFCRHFQRTTRQLLSFQAGFLRDLLNHTTSTQFCCFVLPRALFVFVLSRIRNCAEIALLVLQVFKNDVCGRGPPSSSSSPTSAGSSRFYRSCRGVCSHFSVIIVFSSFFCVFSLGRSRHFRLQRLLPLHTLRLLHPLPNRRWIGCSFSNESAGLFRGRQTSSNSRLSCRFLL